MAHRIERTRTGTPNVYKLTRVDTVTGETTKPPKPYEGRRLVQKDGKTHKVAECFREYAEAREYARQPKEVVTAQAPKSGAGQMLFRDLFDRWVENELSQGAASSKQTRLARKRHLKFFLRPSVTVESITPELVDRWLVRLRDPRYLRLQNTTRSTYAEEWKLLKLVLTYYKETYAYAFPLPLLKRHRKKLVVRVKPKVPKKDLTIEDYQRWLSEMSKRVNRALDRFMATKNPLAKERARHAWEIARRVEVMAKLQYRLIGRGQEVPALHLEDVNADTLEITLQRRVMWSRVSGVEPAIVPGLKNGEAKVIYSPSACQIIAEWSLQEGIKSGPLFFFEGKPLAYRHLQHHYDAAFEASGLGKSGTHVIRHGAGTELHRAAGGDIKQAQKGLGHKSLAVTEGYVGVRDTDFRNSLAVMDERLQSKKA
jgi:integrase